MLSLLAVLTLLRGHQALDALISPWFRFIEKINYGEEKDSSVVTVITFFAIVTIVGVVAVITVVALVNDVAVVTVVLLVAAVTVDTVLTSPFLLPLAL